MSVPSSGSRTAGTRGTPSGWTAPLYWERSADGWRIMTLAGLRDLDEAEPVCHVSYYEADAFARGPAPGSRPRPSGRSPRRGVPSRATSSRASVSTPRPPAASDAAGSPSQLFGDVWEWTRSPYSPYPGYQPAAGALGEYNGKFMCNQMVLRGGSCATPALHIRSTYRNFFPPDARWQFSGIRLARDV